MFRRSSAHPHAHSPSLLWSKRKTADERTTNLDPLTDLQQSIARLMTLLQCIQQENHIMAVKSASDTGGIGIANGSRVSHGGIIASSSSSSTTTTTTTTTTSKNYINNSSSGSQPRTKPSYANILKAQEDSSVNSYFLIMSISNEEEMIELIRHIVDLAVKGEQRAARLLDDSFTPTRTTNTNNINSSISSTSITKEHESPKKNSLLEEETQEEEERGGGSVLVDQTQEAVENEPTPSQPVTSTGNNNGNGNSIFEYFCEVNTLSILTNIATGQAFSNITSNTTTSTTTIPAVSSDIHLYPPISIAMQIIQSVSILVTNLSKVTSLYYILSNNKINDLIHFPMDNYKRAEYNKTQSHKNSSNKRVDISSMGELSEMEAAYVMMLKSLCMRMNTETLQFYMQYDPTGEKTLDIPLYTRALEFLDDPNQDEFIRVTAMNICMNIVRLITRVDHRHDSSDDPDFNGDGTESTTPHGNEYNTRTLDPHDAPMPDSALYQSKALPFRERLALAKFVCLPTHVERLTRGIFLRWTNLCTLLDDSFRNMNRIHREYIAWNDSMKVDIVPSTLEKSSLIVDKTLLEIDEQSRMEEYHKQMENLHSQRAKTMTSFQNNVSDLLHEFMFLEDLLRVGLIPLNEQIIENMFGAVIYPLLLTPLLRFSRKFQRNQADATDSASLPVVSSLVHGNLSSKNSIGVKSLNQPSTSMEGTLTSSESSLANTALFVIASIFRHIKHDQLLQLLATALLHPMTPIDSDDLVLNAEVQLIFEDECGRAYISSDEIQTERGLRLYYFGTCSSSSNSIFHQSSTSSSIQGVYNFIFTPGLFYINNISETGSVPLPIKGKTKLNPFRRILFCCLAGTDGMVELQSIAVYAMDSILATLDGKNVKNIFFDSHTAVVNDDQPLHSSRDIKYIVSDTSEAISNLNLSSTSKHLVEFITSLCVSVMTSFKTYNGSWCLKYNCIAAHAIYYVCIMDETVKKLVLKLIEKRRSQSLSFILEIPSRLEKKLPDSKRSTLDHNLVMDRIFFEPFCKSGKCVIEHICRQQHEGPCDLWCGPGYVSVAKDGYVDDFLEDFCEDISLRRIIETDPEEAAYKSGSNSIVAYLQMDSFVNCLKESLSVSAHAKNTGYMSLSSFGAIDCLQSTIYGKRSLWAPVSDTFSNLLFNENPLADDVVPEAGTILNLVGKAVYPCVCEVKEDNDELFQSVKSYVVSDGIKWQSVYLVISGSYLILTEPVSDSVGDGRIVTSCALTSLVAVYDETLNDENISSMARRLFLRHVSCSRCDPPTLFSITSEDAESKRMKELQKHHKDQLCVTKSKLDLWFEDENAARKALKTLSSKIFKARLKRGQKIFEILRSLEHL